MSDEQTEEEKNAKASYEDQVYEAS